MILPTGMLDGVPWVVDGLRFRRAMSSMDLLAALELCYRVYTLEEGETLFANHERRTYEDPHSTLENLHLLVETPAGEAIGTVRVVKRRAGPYLADAMFEWGTLARHLGQTLDDTLVTTGIASRGAVLPAFRRHLVFERQLRIATELAGRQGLRHLVAVVDPRNTRSINAITKLGWVDYGMGVSERGWSGLRLWKATSEASRGDRVADER